MRCVACPARPLIKYTRLRFISRSYVGKLCGSGTLCEIRQVFFPYLPGDKNAFCGHKRELGRVRVYLENFLSWSEHVALKYFPTSATHQDVCFLSHCCIPEPLPLPGWKRRRRKPFPVVLLSAMLLNGATIVQTSDPVRTSASFFLFFRSLFFNHTFHTFMDLMNLKVIKLKSEA